MFGLNKEERAAPSRELKPMLLVSIMLVGNVVGGYIEPNQKHRFVALQGRLSNHEEDVGDDTFSFECLMATLSGLAPCEVAVKERDISAITLGMVNI